MFVRGDVSERDGVVSVNADRDTSVSVGVVGGDAVVMNEGGAVPVSVDVNSAVTPVVSLLSDDVQVLSVDTSPTGGVEEAIQYTRVVRQMALYGESTGTFCVHCPIVLNSCAVVALVDTGANVTCVLSSLLPELRATLVVKERKLEDYKLG